MKAKLVAPIVPALNKTMTIENVYQKKYFDVLGGGSLLSARRVVPVLMHLVRPRSVIDFGCGVGTWLAVFKENGVERIDGFDGDYICADQLRIPPECLHKVDFESLECNGLPAADLAMSLEVAEHLTPAAGEKLVKAMVQSAGVVAFGAAIPNQGGTHHINEQWPCYWSDLFARYGYEQLDMLRPKIWDDEDIEPWYRQNTFLYVRSDLPLCSELRSISFPSFAKFNVVHPGVLNRSLESARLLSQLSCYDGRDLLKAAVKKLVDRIWRTRHTAKT